MSTAALQILLKAKDKASGIIGRVAGVVGRLGKAALGAATIIGTALVAALGGLIVKSALSAARVEEMNAVLSVLEKNMGLSAGAANKYVESLKSAGITTQVAQTTVAKFIKEGLDLGKVWDLARVAQDAAVISMQDSSQALDGLIHGIVTMNTRVLRTYGITLNDLNLVYDDFAEQHGIAREAMNQEQKVAAVLNAVLEKGTDIAGAYEAAMETAGKQLRSMPRHVTELFNALGGPLQDAFKLVIGGATGFLTTLRDLSAEGEPLNEAMTSLGNIITTVLGPAFGNVETLGAGAEAFAERLRNKFRRLELAVLAFSEGKVSEGLRRLGVPPAVADTIERIVTKLKEFDTSKLTTFFETLKTKFGDVDWSGVEEAWGNLKDTLKTAATDGAQKFVDKINEFDPQVIADGIENLIIKLDELIIKAQDLDWEKIVDVAQFVGTFMLVGGVLLKIAGAAAAIGFWFGEIAAFVGLVIGVITGGGGLMTVLLGLASAFVALVGWPVALALAIGALIAVIVAWGPEFWATIQALWAQIKTIFTLLGPIVQEAVATFSSKIREKLTELKDWIIEKWDALKAGTSEAWDKIKEGAIEKWDEIKEWIEEKLNTLVAWVSEQASEWYQAGIDLIMGLIDGIKKKIDDFIAMIRGLAEDALDVINDILGISSPSTEGRDAMVNLILGMLKGIRAKSPALMHALAGLTDGALGTLDAGLGIMGTANGMTAAGALPNGMAAPVQVTIEYKPIVSLADFSDAESKLVPIIESAFRKLQQEGKVN